MTGENAGSNAGSLEKTLAEIAGLKEALAQQKALAERLASREIAGRETYRYDVKYWTLEQAEAYPLWPPTEGDEMEMSAIERAAQRYVEGETMNQRERIRKELEAEFNEFGGDTLPTEAEYEAEIDRRVELERFETQVGFAYRQEQGEARGF